MTVAQVWSDSGIDPLVVRALEARLLGDVILPGEEEYDTTRKLHNLLIDKYPGLIVRAADAGDVIRAVEFARVRDLPLSVRSGGHSFAGHSMNDGGVVVDLSRMKAISVDPERRTVWVQPGVTSAELCRATEPFGLALTTGDTSTVGIGGLALGGGIGWFVRKYGLTIDHLISVELVTADGRIVVASADQHPDLFWAVRGGGGNFGIVTGFEFRIRPAGTVLGGPLVLPATADVLAGYAAYTPQAPDGLTTIGFLMQAPPMPFLPAEWHGKLVFMILPCYVGEIEDGQRAIDPLRALATPVADLVCPMPYSAIFNLTEMGAQPHASMNRSGFVDELDYDTAAAIIKHFEQNPTPVNLVQIRGLGGAMARVPASETAFVHRDKQILLAIISMGGRDEDRQWIETLWQELRPEVSGVYVNFLEDEGEARIEEAYSATTYARLAEVKRSYDPTNLFRLNQNIRPATS